ncbi:hypothetical protein KL912_002931 [Ogataea haglerorum]|nr:hypothetical protein KL912_002931 [Ogataea haglerorum]
MLTDQYRVWSRSSVPCLHQSPRDWRICATSPDDAATLKIPAGPWRNQAPENGCFHYCSVVERDVAPVLKDIRIAVINIDEVIKSAQQFLKISSMQQTNPRPWDQRQLSGADLVSKSSSPLFIAYTMLKVRKVRKSTFWLQLRHTVHSPRVHRELERRISHY